MANPLDLPGPQFLAFYTLVAAIVLVLLWLARGAAERGHVPRVDTSDPFLIADLRAGPSEALRVAAVSLIDRGLLVVDDAAGTLQAKQHGQLMRPIERALQHAFKQPRPATDIFTDPELSEACVPYESTLTRLGLLPDADTRRARHRRLAFAVAVLALLAGTKIVVALQRGRTNIGFLIVLALVACVIAWALSMARRTGRGDALLADLRRLFGRLRERAASVRPGGATAEAALLAAVFGLGALPAGGFGYVRRLYPRSVERDSSLSSFWCGSSCGSSCGGGGGGGGAGDGGGGGCGGCGGGGGD